MIPKTGLSRQVVGKNRCDMLREWIVTLRGFGNKIISAYFLNPLTCCVFLASCLTLCFMFLPVPTSTSHGGLGYPKDKN